MKATMCCFAVVVQIVYDFSLSVPKARMEQIQTNMIKLILAVEDLMGQTNEVIAIRQ